jgi:hypothetical protein
LHSHPSACIGTYSVICLVIGSILADFPISKWRRIHDFQDFDRFRK